MLRFVDGFDHYNPAVDIGLKYTQVAAAGFSLLTQGTGRFAGFCLQCRGEMISLGMGAAQPSWTVGFAFQYGNSASLPVALVQFLVASTPLFNVYLDAAGRLNLGQGSTNGLTPIDAGSPKVGTTVLAPAVWYYVEVQFATAAGNIATFAVHLNGVSEINWSGTKASASIDTIAFSDNQNARESTNAPSSFDDLYILDGTGSRNTTFLGDQRVETLYPTGAGTSTAWTPVGGGTNFGNVNTAGSEDGDTNYIAATAAGVIDSYAMGDLSTTPSAINAVVVTSIARKDDAGTRTYCGLVRSGGVNYVTGQVNALVSSYRTYQDVFEQDPNAGAGWTGPTINAMEAGVKLLS